MGPSHEAADHAAAYLAYPVRTPMYHCVYLLAYSFHNIIPFRFLLRLDSVSRTVTTAVRYPRRR
jgi:hypothetical protein